MKVLSQLINFAGVFLPGYSEEGVGFLLITISPCQKAKGLENGPAVGLVRVSPLFCDLGSFFVSPLALSVSKGLVIAVDTIAEVDLQIGGEGPVERISKKHGLP